jgi:hypothetical protein
MLSTHAKEYPDSEATNVLDENWDNLIILDACRYDAFLSEAFNMDGMIGYDKDKHIISVASSTGEWFSKTFKVEAKDIIYVSANPWISEQAITEIPGQQNIGFNPFFKLVNLWLDRANVQHNTIHPRLVTETAKRLMKLHPDKRFIIHYMQPHDPYIGAEKLFFPMWEQTRLEMFRLDKTIKGEKFRLGNYKPEKSMWNVMKEGILTRDEVVKSYMHNLRLVLGELDDWKGFEGKTVITADHGECFLDWGIDGHPSGMRVEELVKVPWFELK